MIGLPTADKVTDWGISQGDAKQDGCSSQNITLSKENWATLSWVPLFELCRVGLPLVVTHRISSEENADQGWGLSGGGFLIEVIKSFCS